jgi:KaiC/GvpD/RAD55 family RecA-like ATPase
MSTQKKIPLNQKVSLIALAAKELFEKGINSDRVSSTVDETQIVEKKNLEMRKLAISKIDSRRVNSSGLQDARRELASLVESGTANQALINVIYDGEGFLPIEGLLIDYKREIPSDRYGSAKFLRHILAFHNTFGGFLVVGADETRKDSQIIPIQHDPNTIDTKKIRDLCREYFSTAIEIQSLPVEVYWRGERSTVSVIHIPKRVSKEPVLVRKDGPKDSSGAAAFCRDDVYLRDGDNTIRASNANHWRILYGDRGNPYLASFKAELEITKPIWSVLPDRGFICQEFIGRDDLLSQLYSWLADDFTCVRVLAGEGGLGKTSAAYQFATEISKSHLIDVESVVWVTAKRQQFRAMLNAYEEVTNRHFSTSTELFAVIASNLGDIRTSWDDVSENEFPRILRDLARHIKVFFVIDDLDSLELDEQKRSIEVCQQLAGLGSRFLFTTRKNATASTSTAIEVKGLDSDDYPKLIESWSLRLGLKSLSPKEINKLRETTLGSPLYTESLLRLVKGGMPVGEAIAKWKDNLGIEVRNAALKREVVQLENEAKKVLVAAAILGQCSLAEIKQATGYSDPTLIDATNELQSLFLLHAPSIADQPRFSISNTTRDLVLALGPELISEFNSFQDAIKQKRYKSKGQRADLQVIGIAVNQATALLAAQQPEQALRTVDEVNLQFSGKNPDLLFMRGRVLLRFTPIRRTDARKAFRLAHSLGQRKPLFFSLWYENEISLGYFEPAIDVATAALSASVGERSDWLMRRANSRLQCAYQQDRRHDYELAKSQLSSAADDLSLANTIDSSLQWNAIWKESLFRTHDSLWTLSVRAANSVPEQVEALDSQLAAVKRGDNRLEVYKRLHIALGSLSSLIKEKSENMSEREANLFAQRSRWCSEIINSAPKELNLYREFREMKRSIGTI